MKLSICIGNINNAFTVWPLRRFPWNRDLILRLARASQTVDPGGENNKDNLSTDYKVYAADYIELKGNKH